MGLAVCLAVNCANACYKMYAVVKIVEREVQVQHEMQGQNCALMKLLCFLYFYSVLWSNIHHFGGTYCLHLEGDWIASSEC